MNSTLNAACSINHINTPSYHFKYINTCIMDMYLIIHKDTLSEIRDERPSVNRQGLCGSWFEVKKLLVAGINEPLFLSTWQKIMYTSGSINGSNKSYIHLPLDRMAAVPASTHSSLNAKLLLRGRFFPSLHIPWTALDNVSMNKSPAWRIPRHKCPPCFWGSGHRRRLVRAAGRLAGLCKNQYRASTHCLMELLRKRESWQAVLTKGEHAQGFHRSTQPYLDSG